MCFLSSLLLAVLGLAASRGCSSAVLRLLTVLASLAEECGLYNHVFESLAKHGKGGRRKYKDFSCHLYSGVFELEIDHQYLLAV